MEFPGFLLPCSAAKRRCISSSSPTLPCSDPFDSISDDLLQCILDFLVNPFDKKSFSLVSRRFLSVESRHRRSLTPLRLPLLPSALSRYPFTTTLDFTLLPRVPDTALSSVAASLGATLRSIDLSRSKSFSHFGIAAITLNCPGIVKINLSNATEINDRVAAAIGKARHLEQLWLARCKAVTDMGIGCIAVGCPKLRLLSLKWCLGITDLGVGLVAVKCKEMRSLDLSYMQITNKCLSALLQLHNLEDFALVGCPGIDDEGLTGLRKGCKNLKALNLSNSQYVSHAGLSFIESGPVNLQQLTLAYCCPITYSLANSLKGLSKLQSLKLDGCKITESGLKAIASFNLLLREISLSKCSGVTDESLSFIATKQKSLLKLDVTCCRKITDVSLTSITSSCTSLTSLRMESCSLVSKEAFVLIGERCPLLEELDLTDTELDDEGLRAISSCSKLSSLKIGICVNISDEGLCHLGTRCSNLRELDLYRLVKITDAGVAAVALGCPMLQTVNLSYCTKITDQSLFSLSKCSELDTLEIRGCFHVLSTGLLAVAGGCKQLSKLDIKKCYNVDDTAMLPLARFSQNLRQINLSYCSVTDVGLLVLASVSCLQDMTILHLKGLSANGLLAALLACGSLIKVKLHSSFKSTMCQEFIDHMQARGCIFHWRDKPFQVEQEANEVWKQQSHGILVV